MQPWALGATRAEPRINVGLLIFAAFLPDFLLGVFALFGLEQAHVPSDFASRHYLTFTFSYFHGLLALACWGVLLGALLCWLDRKDRMRAFLVIAATMAIAGLAIYWKLAGNTTGRRWGFAVFILLLTALTWLQLWAVTPPNPSQLVPGWIVAPLVFSAIPYLLDRKRVSAQT